MRKKRRSSCVRITKHLLFYATSVLPIPASRFSPPQASGPIPHRGRENRGAKGEEDTLSCFPFLYQCIYVGQPQHFACSFSFLEMRGPMFRWSGCWQNSPAALSGVSAGAFWWCIQILIWVWGSILHSSEEKCGCCDEKKSVLC